jgi:hypothetical protein
MVEELEILKLLFMNGNAALMDKLEHVSLQTNK